MFLPIVWFYFICRTDLKWMAKRNEKNNTNKEIISKLMTIKCAMTHMDTITTTTTRRIPVHIFQWYDRLDFWNYPRARFVLYINYFPWLTPIRFTLTPTLFQYVCICLSSPLVNEIISEKLQKKWNTNENMLLTK